MKNFWLDRNGPKKTKINIWASASVTGGEEELISSSEVAIPKTEVVCLRQATESSNSVYDVTRFNPMSVINNELDDMLYHYRIGKALARRYEEKNFSGHAMSIETMKAQWKPGPGEKLMTQWGMLFIKAADQTLSSCPTVIIEK